MQRKAEALHRIAFNSDLIPNVLVAVTNYTDKPKCFNFASFSPDFHLRNKRNKRSMKSVDTSRIKISSFSCELQIALMLCSRSFPQMCRYTIFLQRLWHKESILLTVIISLNIRLKWSLSDKKKKKREIGIICPILLTINSTELFCLLRVYMEHYFLS